MDMKPFGGIPRLTPGAQQLSLSDASSGDPRQGMSANYRDPVYDGRWLAASAPVGNTGYMVVVQQPYDEAIPAAYGLWWAGIALAVGAILLGVFTWSAVQRGLQRRWQPSQS